MGKERRLPTPEVVDIQASFYSESVGAGYDKNSRPKGVSQETWEKKMHVTEEFLRTRDVDQTAETCGIKPNNVLPFTRSTVMRLWWGCPEEYREQYPLDKLFPPSISS